MSLLRRTAGRGRIGAVQRVVFQLCHGVFRPEPAEPRLDQMQIGEAGDGRIDDDSEVRLVGEMRRSGKIVKTRRAAGLVWLERRRLGRMRDDPHVAPVPLAERLEPLERPPNGFCFNLSLGAEKIDLVPGVDHQIRDAIPQHRGASTFHDPFQRRRLVLRVAHQHRDLARQPIPSLAYLCLSHRVDTGGRIERLARIDLGAFCGELFPWLHFRTEHRPSPAVMAGSVDHHVTQPDSVVGGNEFFPNQIQMAWMIDGNAAHRHAFGGLD